MKYLIIIAMVLSCGIGFADECMKPEDLSPELKQAYYELLEISKEIKGMSVKILCEEAVITKTETEKGITYESVSKDKASAE